MAGAIALAGCSSDPNSIAGQANKGDDKGFIAGDGTIEQLSADQRGKPVTVSGTLLDGTPWSSSSVAGKVVVLNVWGAWCAPCQEELPHLQAAWEQWQKSGAPVVMMGIDQRDSPQRAAATLRKFGVTYPSLAEDGGKALLALQGKVTATPTTLILDPQHRIAARVIGAVTTDATLTGLVDDILKNK